MRLTIGHSVLLVISSATLFAEAPPQDMQTAQVLLQEVRQLRFDLQMMAATVQRVQIAMFRLQAQASIYESANQRLEQIKSDCELTRQNRESIAQQLEHPPETPHRFAGPTDSENREDFMRSLRASLEAFTAQEQQCQAKLANAESQYRLEQAKLNSYQDQLERLDQYLSGGKR